MVVAGPNRAWATLLTRSSYLPGVLTLAYTLSKHQTKYPLVVLITPSLPDSAVRALELEQRHNPLLQIHRVESLVLPSNHRTKLITPRFADTWTKLRVFGLTQYDGVVFLDADITMFRNMDSIFNLDLPGTDWLAANHVCVCNLDHDSWASADWIPENCAYTPLQHPSALTSATPVPHSSSSTAHRSTYTLLNSGVFLFHPSARLHNAMMDAFNTSPHLSSYQFPDQDFLTDFFRDHWISVGWQYNALKTMKQWHTNIWRDSKVRALHYIVDKPWEKRVAADGIGGYLGRDGQTHMWWWDIWEEYRRERLGDFQSDVNGSSNGNGHVEKHGEYPEAEELLGIVDELVAPQLDEEAERKQIEENRKKGLPISLPNYMRIGKDSGTFVDIYT